MKKSVTEVKGEFSWTPKPSSPSHSGEILSTITTTPPPRKFPDERAYWLEEVWYYLKRISSIIERLEEQGFSP
ncbi:hypothetical protein AAHC03_022888 [Spirometra sp. Aus1]